MNFIKRLWWAWHRWQHRRGANLGEVECFWEGPRLMVGFRCHGCRELSGVHESVTTARPLHRN